MENPFKTINGLNRTYFYFLTEPDAEAWANAARYESTVSKVSEGLYEVAEHYYNLKQGVKAGS